jgi:malonyl CoA-acyl carrier protein transacylase
MGAMVNATKEQIESILAGNGLTNIDIADYNTPSRIVIPGLLEER